MKWKERSLWGLLLFFSLFLNVFSESAKADETSKYHHLFSSVLFYLEKMYVDELDEKDLILGAVRGMLSATKDPYTRFLDREEHKEFSSMEKGKKAGIGVEVTLENGIPLVIAPVEGSPAEKAGIRAGDRILSIDGRSLKNMSFGDMLKLISGDTGTAVDIEVLHQGEQTSEKIRVVRGVFQLDYCRGEIISDGKIGYIRLSHFFGGDSGIVDKFQKYLIQFKKENVRGIVVDLRNNAGGHLDMAVTLSGYFLEKGDLVVSAKGRDSSMNREYRASGKTGIVKPEVPVAVLINQGSASASEIMAGALQDHKRAVLIGNKSFGKGSVQQIVRSLPDDTAALITIQKYFTPSGKSIHGIGLSPDINADSIQPDEDDRYYYAKMMQSGFFKKFKDEHPVYKSELKKIFHDASSAAGYPLSENFSFLILKSGYPDARQLVDLELDFQLSRAVKELISH